MNPQMDPRSGVTFDRAQESEPRTMPQLQCPGPPDWPRLPRIVGCDMEEPPSERTVLELKEPPRFTKFPDPRGAISSALHRFGLDTLGDAVAKKNFLFLQGPLFVTPRNWVVLTWPSNDDGEVQFVCKVPHGLRLLPGESAVLRLIDNKIERIRNTKAVRKMIDARIVPEWENL